MPVAVLPEQVCGDTCNAQHTFLTPTPGNMLPLLVHSRIAALE
jgi:hypothetical protein